MRKIIFAKKKGESNKMLVIRAEIHKTVVRIAMKTLIGLLQKQSDLGLHCLSRHFWQATSV